MGGAPAPFSHATASTAEVIRTQTLANPNGGSNHIAELSGIFFPRQVRHLVEVLRVLLPRFSCDLVPDAQHSVGVNAFTQLGMQRLEAIECERTHNPKEPAPGWKWKFKVGT